MYGENITAALKKFAYLMRDKQVIRPPSAEEGRATNELPRDIEPWGSVEEGRAVHLNLRSNTIRNPTTPPFSFRFCEKKAREKNLDDRAMA
jgi:hypothetical protein